MSEMAISRELMLADKEFQIAMAEAAYLESMIDNKLRINLAKAEYKVLTESADASTVCGDLVYLFNEAGKEAEQQKEGVVKKVANAVYGFFVKIWNSIQKIFTGQNTNAYNELMKTKQTFDCPFDPQKLLQGASQLNANLSDNIKANLGKTGPIIAALTAILGVIALWGKKIYKATGKVVRLIWDGLTDALNKAKKSTENASEEDQNTDANTPVNEPTEDGGTTEKKGFMGSVASVLSKIFKKIGGWFNTIISRIKGGSNTNNGETTTDDNNNKSEETPEEPAKDATADTSGDSNTPKDPNAGNGSIPEEEDSTAPAGESANEYVDPEMMALLESL